MARERAPELIVSRKNQITAPPKGYSPGMISIGSISKRVGCWNRINCIKLLCSVLFIDYQYCLCLWSILVILMGEANNKLFEKETLSNFTRMACRNIPTWKFLIGFTTFCWPGSLSSGAHHRSPPQGAAPEEHSTSHQPTAVTWVAYITMHIVSDCEPPKLCNFWFGDVWQVAVHVFLGAILMRYFWHVLTVSREIATGFPPKKNISQDVIDYDYDRWSFPLFFPHNFQVSKFPILPI